MPTDNDAANAADVLRKSRRETLFGMIMRSLDFLGMDSRGRASDGRDSTEFSIDYSTTNAVARQTSSAAGEARELPTEPSWYASVAGSAVAVRCESNRIPANTGLQHLHKFMAFVPNVSPCKTSNQQIGRTFSSEACGATISGKHRKNGGGFWRFARMDLWCSTPVGPSSGTI